MMIYQHSHFLLAFSSLFPVIGPISTALIIYPYFAGLSPEERRASALKVVFYSFALGVGSILFGSWVLKIMGVSAPVTKMAGGILIASMGLKLLNSGESDHKKTDAGADRNSLFYPFAFPLTMGPGGISVLITLGASKGETDFVGTLLDMASICAALMLVLIIAFFCYAYENFFIQRLGKTGENVLNRLMAFFVFCVGLEMVLTGFTTAYPNFLK